ncbi:nucleotidyltransferase family protein [Phyllobacterium sp. K27]
MKEIDLVYRTMFAELVQRTLDGNFKADFPVDGRFVSVPVKGNEYWYFDYPTETGDKRIYVGPKLDEEIAKRVNAFQEIKNDIRGRRKLVSTLIREARMSAPEQFTGDIVEALSNAGIFRLRAVLIGTVAFQTYSGILGIRLPSAVMQTGDADFAQFHSISVNVQDTIPPILEVLRTVDASFRQIPHQGDPLRTTQFQNSDRYKVEFLTPNTGSDDFVGIPADMPALGGAAAEPMRFLDYLIYEPVRTVLLHKSGVVVNVPTPERYAIHKLIVSARRRNDSDGIQKRDKDVQQAGLLIEALVATRRQSDLAMAFAEAWNRGASWQEAIRRGASFVGEKGRDALLTGLTEGMPQIGDDIEAYKI